MKRAVVLSALLLGGCVPRYVGVLRSSHGREFRCDGRYVLVQKDEETQRWYSRGCGFEAEWECAHGECRLHDSRAWGMGAQ